MTMPSMNTDHRSVVPAPLWALEVLRQRRATLLAPQGPRTLPGLEVHPCPFDAWLAAGGERRQRPRAHPPRPTA